MLPTKTTKVHKGFKSVHAFANYAYGLKDNGDVYAWGSNKRGRLGLPAA